VAMTWRTIYRRAIRCNSRLCTTSRTERRDDQPAPRRAQRLIDEIGADEWLRHFLAVLEGDHAASPDNPTTAYGCTRSTTKRSRAFSRFARRPDLPGRRGCEPDGAAVDPPGGKAPGGSYRILANTYRPRATRTNNGDGPVEWDASTQLTESFDTVSPTIASTAA
jgi:hypothetical protein